MSVADKMAKLDAATASLRHVVRHNGAAISRNADITEVAAHFLDCDPDRVKLLWYDIGTIDQVKKYLKLAKNMKRGTVELLRWANPMKFPEMTTEELLEYGINDERLTAEEYSWAVMKITKTGTEILTYGGNFYQAYKTVTESEDIVTDADVVKVEDPTVYGLEEGNSYYMLEGVSLVVGEEYQVTVDGNTLTMKMETAEGYDAYGHNASTLLEMDVLVLGGNTFIKFALADGSDAPSTTTATVTRYYKSTVQYDDTELLKQVLEAVDAAWMAETFEADVHSNPVYTENDAEYIQIPCTIPGDLSQLISIQITRTKLEDGSEAAALEYSLTENSCDTSNEGMVALPHGMWLIYDNSTLENAPQALLVPKELADGTETGYRFDRVKIHYNSLASGLARLRLVGDSFGDEYIVSTQDDLSGGTWRE